jgi:RND family efflux transporter MFP subunit
MQKTKKKKMFIVASVAGLIVFAAVITGLRSKQERPAADAAGPVPVAVEVSPVKPGTITESISSVGTIAAIRDVVVSSETAGRVTKVLVKVGDAVRQDQPLVLVDDELKTIAVDQARAQLLAAETNFRKAEKDFARAEKLYASGDIADVELEGNRLALRSAEAQYKSAVVGLKYAQRQLADTRIKSPIAGRVATRKVELGEMVAPGKEVANIIDITTMKVRLGIPEEDIGKLRVGQPATLRVDALPGRTFTGAVFTIGSKSENPTGHTYPVEVVVRNTDINALRVGMFARVEIAANSVTGALSISKESLVGDIANPAVFVADSNVARFRPVKLGLRSGDTYQVIDGLSEGDLVISFGQKSLKDGTPIRYK